MNIKKFISFIILATLVSGCSIIPKSFDNPIPIEHVLMFDSAGNPVNPTGNFGKLIPTEKSCINSNSLHWAILPYQNESNCEYQQHINKIGNEINKFQFNSKKKKLLFFIHGGLNTQLDSLERVVETFENNKSRTKLIKDAGYYPIYINWKSSLISSYLEHLFWLRQGETNKVLGFLTSPFVLATDLGKSLLRWPLVESNLIMNDKNTVPGLPDSNPEIVAKELLCLKYNNNKLNSCIQNLTFREPPKITRLPTIRNSLIR